MKARKFQGHVLPPYVYVKKKIYLYFIKDGNLCPLPNDPASAEFYAVYTACLKNEITGPAKQTMGELSLAYLASDKFKKVAGSTAKGYRSKINWIIDRCKDVQVKKMTRKVILEMRDARKDQPVTANATLTMMKILLEYAIDLDWISFNPAKGVPSLDKNAEEREPWTDEEIAAFHDHADPRASLILELLLNTGQRLNDALAMKWSQCYDDPIAGYGIEVKQRKTKAKVFIPFSNRLKDAIKRLDNQIDRSGSDYIIVNKKDPGEQLPVITCQVLMSKVKEKIGVTKTLHDLRHSCAHRLAEQGLSAEAIMSITGHTSVKMVHHYCNSSKQKAQAKIAMATMDQAA
jgi:integrase